MAQISASFTTTRIQTSIINYICSRKIEQRHFVQHLTNDPTPCTLSLLVGEPAASARECRRRIKIRSQYHRKRATGAAGQESYAIILYVQCVIATTHCLLLVSYSQTGRNLFFLISIFILRSFLRFSLFRIVSLFYSVVYYISTLEFIKIKSVSRLMLRKNIYKNKTTLRILEFINSVYFGKEPD